MSLHLLSIDNTPIPPTSLESDLQNPSSPLYFLPFPIQSILLQNQTIFQKPRGLSPPRPHDRHIPLLPYTPPINVKPYHYPHSHKEIITQLSSRCFKRVPLNPTQALFLPSDSYKKKRGYLTLLCWLQSLKCNHNSWSLPNSYHRWIARWTRLTYNFH